MRGDILSKENVDRRTWLKVAGGTIAGLIVGGALEYVAKPTVTAPPVTTTVTETVTGTVPPPVTTVAPPATTVARPVIRMCCDSGHNYLPWFDPDVGKGGPDYGQNQAPLAMDALGVTIVGDQLDSGTEFSVIMADLTGPKKWNLITYFPTYNGDIMGGGWLVPLDDFIKKYNVDMSQYSPVYRYLYCSWGGKTYALPYDGDVHNLYYRKDVFADPDNMSKFKTQYGYDLAPPTTYAQYLDIAKFFTGWDWGKGAPSGGAKYGTAEDFMDLTWGLFFDRFASLGGLWFDENFNPLVPNDAAVTALTDLIKMIPFMPPGILGMGAVEVFDAMTKGLAAMCLTWPDVGPRAGSGAFPIKGDQVGTAQVPGYQVGGTLKRLSWTGVGRVMGITVSTPPELQETVFKVIKWMSVDHSDEFVPSGLNGEDPFAYHISDPKNLPNWEKSNPGWSDAGILDYLKGNSLNYSNGYPDLYMPGASEYTDTFSRYIMSACKGEISPKQAIDRTISDWNATTKKLGADKQKALWQQQIVSYKLAGIWPSS
jgi:multiple sugar transport system substrate-binding protein